MPAKAEAGTLQPVGVGVGVGVGVADNAAVASSGALAAQFANRLVAWQQRHGRNGLPWQGSRDPYRVWLSEVMLQQTQVATVVGYYDRFLQRLPHVQALAHASQQEVLALWSGLGYYSRARNLHRCARQVCEEYGGQFPRTAAALAQLPGIGPSTAAAIAAFSFGERVSILDANVQRVLARVLGFGHDLVQARHVKALWQMANGLLPQQPSQPVMTAYTQGLMDLGALVCTPRQPQCAQCPMQDICAARQQGCETQWPVRNKRLKRSAERWWMLLLQSPQGIWLQQRPQQGIWAGLHVLPLFGSEHELQFALAQLPAAQPARHAPAFKHVLTHKDLYLHPVQVLLPDGTAPALEGGWHADWQAPGLPAPMRKWLHQHLSG